MTTTRDVVVVGASAGGVSALERFVAGLPEDLAATVLVVLHISRASALDRILDRRTPLEVRFAAERDELRHGLVLVAPPQRHLAVVDDEVELTSGPRENGHRPAVDVLFRTAARALGPRVQAVVLSGTLDDGVAGAAAVKRRGGLVLTQVADDCHYPGMPENTRRRVGADVTASAARLGGLVAAHAIETVDPDTAPVVDDTLERETLVARNHRQMIFSGDQIGPASGFGCPDCGGALYSVTDDAVLRYRCRIGHGWTATALYQTQDESTESALGVALRALEEKVDLSRRLAAGAAAEGRHLSAQQFLAVADTAERSAKELARLVATFSAARAATDDIDAREDEGDPGQPLADTTTGEPS